MAERGISLDHSTVHRWVVHFSLQLLERFNRRKLHIGGCCIGYRLDGRSRMSGDTHVRHYQEFRVRAA